jgi:hypothetical protein
MGGAGGTQPGLAAKEIRARGTSALFHCTASRSRRRVLTVPVVLFRAKDRPADSIKIEVLFADPVPFVHAILVVNQKIRISQVFDDFAGLIIFADFIPPNRR